MKITREARQTAKKIFSLCVPEGRMDEVRLRQAVKVLVEQRPRGYQPILARLKKLVEIEFKKRTVTVDSAVALPDQGAAIFKAVASQLGAALVTDYRVTSGLIGGARIQVGSNVWDGSIRGRLNALTKIQ